MVIYVRRKRIGEWAGSAFCKYFLLSAATLSPLGSHAQASAPVVKDELLNALQTLRQAVRSKVASGYGVAVEKTTDTQRYAHGMSIHYQPQIVKFWFLGNTSLAKEYSSGHPPMLLQAALRKDGVLVHFRRYSMGLKLVVPQVTVQSGVLPHMENDLRPVVWTYRRITEISSVMQPDAQFFPIAERQSAASVKETGRRIIVTFSYPPNLPSFFGEKVVIVFDMVQGGMVTSYYHMTDELDAAKHRVKENDAIATRWRKEGGCWLPASRTLESHYWNSGKYRGFTRTKIKFLKFVPEPLPGGILTVKNLQIPEGTFVDDTVHKELYHFTKATAARMLAARKHTPSGQPGGAK
jgi:hypothetical protein